MSIDRSKWKGWKELPTPLEGNTGKWKKYQSLLFKTVSDLKPKLILETGFNAGHSACCFLNASETSKMYTFDICRWGTEEPAEAVLKNNGFDITLIKGSSDETLPKFFEENSDMMFDFVFIDGGHDNDVPYNDMKNVKDNINVGGVLIIDDMTVGSVKSCFNRHDWTGFDISKPNDIEKDVRILTKKEVV